MWDLTVPGNGDHDFYTAIANSAVLVHNCGQDPAFGIVIEGDIPEPGEIDRGSLRKMKNRTLEKALETVGEDAHSFKEAWVGWKDVSRFDVMKDGEGRLVLMKKNGAVLVPTNYWFALWVHFDATFE
jgi:hypothetical protein